MNTLDLAKQGLVIPVIVINRVEDAALIAAALLEGGIRVLEVTLRSSCALQAMEQIAKHKKNTMSSTIILYSLSLREIVRRLGRSHSSISRELKCNVPVRANWVYWVTARIRSENGNKPKSYKE